MTSPHLYSELPSAFELPLNMNRAPDFSRRLWTYSNIRDKGKNPKPTLLSPQKSNLDKQTLYRKITKTKAIISNIKDMKRHRSMKEKDKNRFLFINFKKEHLKKN